MSLTLLAFSLGRTTLHLLSFTSPRAGPDSSIKQPSSQGLFSEWMHAWRRGLWRIWPSSFPQWRPNTWRVKASYLVEKSMIVYTNFSSPSVSHPDNGPLSVSAPVHFKFFKASHYIPWLSCSLCLKWTSFIWLSSGVTTPFHPLRFRATPISWDPVDF